MPRRAQRSLFYLALLSLLVGLVSPVSSRSVPAKAAPVAPAMSHPNVTALPMSAALRSRMAPSSFVPAPLRSASKYPRLAPLATPTANAEEPLPKNAKASASSEFATDGLYVPPWHANDGDPDSEWASSPDESLPQWWQVDFGRVYTMTRLLSSWDSPDGQIYDYAVAVSMDGASFTQVATHEGVTGQATDTFEARGRYLRVTIDANDPGTDTTVWVKEFEVYGILAMSKDEGSPCSCQKPQGKSQADPFNPRTGFLWTSATDLAAASSGPPLVWSRTYVSRAITETTEPLGIGWQYPYNTRLITETMPGGEPGLAIIVAPDGNRWRFQDLEFDDGSYRSFPGVDRTLQFVVTFTPPSTFVTTYVLTNRDQSRWTYDPGGRLIDMQDAQGHHLSLTYDPTHPARLTRVADAQNPDRYLELTYNGGGRISRVSDGVRAATYTYTTTGDLIRATDVMSRPTDYTYQNHLLTKITNALGQTVEETTYDQYTPDGRVIDQTLLDGQHFEVEYESDKTTITVTGPDGRQELREFRYDQSETLTGTSINGLSQSASDFEAHFAPGSITDANDHTTTAVYNDMGQPTSVTNALGQTTLAVYDSQNHPITATDTLGRQTASVYDAHNNLVRQTTGITTAFPLGFTTIFTYTTDNRLQERRGPDGVVTRYDYDIFGQVLGTTVGYGTPLAQMTDYAYDQFGRVVTTFLGVGTPEARADVTRYNADNTIAEVIQNYENGVFEPNWSDEDIGTTYGYDQLGRMVAITDTLGRVDLTHYDGQGRVDWTARNAVPAQFDSHGLPVYHAYDTAQPDANVATLYGLDGLGRTILVTQTGILTGTFNPATLQFSQATERVTRTEYDSLSRPVTVTLNYRPGLPPGAETNVQLLTRYDAAGNVVGQRDALGRWAVIDYDELNRPITTTLNYENGDPLTVDLANQGWTDGSDTDLVTVTRYDSSGQVERRIDNYVDGVFSATQPITDRITLYQYDALSRVITTTVNYAPGASDTALNRVSVSAYDSITGRALGRRDQLGRWVSQQYDLLGRVETTVQNCTGTSAPQSCGSQGADQNVPATTHYDGLGRAFETVDALGHTAHTSYDGMGSVLARTQNYVASGPTTAITNVTTLSAYDPLGRTIVMTDALGYASQMSYNGLGQTAVLTDTMSRVTHMGYDGSGTLRWTKRNDGQLTVYQVNGLGRVVATVVNYQDGAVGASEPPDQDLTSRIVHDAAGRRLRAIDTGGRATAFAYDQQDRLIAVTENAVDGSCAQAPCNVITRYQYDRAGNRIAIVDANGHTRRFGYDAANQQISATDPLTQTTSWEYDAGGRMTVQHDPRGITDTLTFSYDGLDRQTQTAATNLSTISVQYDALGQRLSLTDGTGTTSFSYDPIGRMTQLSAPNTGSVGYGYDAKGQRSGLTYPGGATLQYAYWPDGQIRTVTDTTTLASYSYDQAGRPQQVTRANSATTTYDYDGADRLIASTTEVSSTTVGAFQYDVDRLGMRTVVTETLGTDSTALVADIRPSSTGSTPGKGVTIGGTYFFAANDGTNGTELWKSDGTAAGTVLVKDIVSGSTSSSPGNLTVVNGTLFFSANDGTNGTELWKSDGTTSGTVLVKDIRSGSNSSFPGNLTAVNGTLFFTANDGTNGTELWKSDGTATGTVLVKDIQSGSGSSLLANLTAVNGMLFFAANDGTNGQELWKSDGTATGTVLVKDIQSGSSGSSVFNSMAVNGTLFFTANDGTNGQELWKSDGTTSGTVLVKDIRPGTSSSPASLTAVNGTLFFSANDGTNGTELWKSDGTSAGTVLVKDIWSGVNGSSPANLTALNGALFFGAFDGVNGTELWKSDGTTAGTVLVKDINPSLGGVGPGSLTVTNNRLFFTADDGTAGKELWVSDGTAAGTMLVEDIRSGSSGSNPSNLSASVGRLLFAADDGVHGGELWLHSDGYRVVRYSYDGLQRLSGADESTGAAYGYGYDNAGNRTSLTVNGQTTTTTYNAANQVSGFSYDAAGNLTGDGTTSYTYDALNRLTARGTTSYTYNGDGALVYDGATHYTQDLAAPLSQVLQTTQGLTTTSYLYGRERLAGVQGSTRTWYGSDALGSVRQTLSDSGSVLNTVNYDPWGTVESGSVPTFGFTGELQDANTGLVNLRARWYSTGRGTFTTRDTFLGSDVQPMSMHPYLYTGANPINRIDPSGHCYGALEFLRNVPWESDRCKDLDKAVLIYTSNNPNVSGFDKAWAYGYAASWYVGHAILVAEVAFSATPGAAAGAGTAISNGITWIWLQGAAYLGAAGSLLQSCSQKAGALIPPSSPSSQPPPQLPSPIEAQELIDNVLQNELKYVDLTFHPEYNPDIPLNEYGSSLPETYTHIGPGAILDGRGEVVETIVHEEMHHRVWRISGILENPRQLESLIDDTTKEIMPRILEIPQAAENYIETAAEQIVQKFYGK